MIRRIIRSTPMAFGILCGLCALPTHHLTASQTGVTSGEMIRVGDHLLAPMSEFTAIRYSADVSTEDILRRGMLDAEELGLEFVKTLAAGH